MILMPLLIDKCTSFCKVNPENISLLFPVVCIHLCDRYVHDFFFIIIGLLASFSTGPEFEVTSVAQPVVI
jgi:hypothetical protein